MTPGSPTGIPDQSTCRAVRGPLEREVDAAVQGVVTRVVYRAVYEAVGGVVGGVVYVAVDWTLHEAMEGAVGEAVRREP